MEYRKLFSGIFALLIYFVLLGLIFYYFNYHSESKSVHFVEKNDNKIEVAMGAQEKKKAAKKKSNSKKNPEKKRPKPKPEPVKKPLPKPEPKEKPEPTKKEKPEPAEKPQPTIKPKPQEKPKKIEKQKPEPKKKPELKSLFDNVDTSKPKPDKDEKEEEDSIKQEEKKSENKKKSDSIKNVKNSDMGIVNAYVAKVEKKLQDWPAQSEFAGEVIKLRLKINTDGTFEFRLLTPSNNQDFNNGLVQYLQQLQKIGFDPHQNTKPYEFDVEFVAKE